MTESSSCYVIFVYTLRGAYTTHVYLTTWFVLSFHGGQKTNCRGDTDLCYKIMAAGMSNSRQGVLLAYKSNIWIPVSRLTPVCSLERSFQSQGLLNL